jgi:(aminoalkyl)phosphonate N-acetyltransferase
MTNNSNTIKVRKATPNDLSSVYELVCKLENETLKQEVFEQIFEANLKSPDCFYFVAETENKIVGFISFHVQYLLHHCGAVGEVQEFYLEKDFRSQGIGKRLMNEVKKYAKANDVKSLEVTSNKNRAENINVYESLGFKLTHNKFTI